MANNAGYPVQATEAWWGVAQTDSRTYKPLDEILVKLRAPIRGAHRYLVIIFDAAGKKYGSAVGEMKDAQVVVSFTAGGSPGMQYIKIWFDPQGEDVKHDRLLNIYLEACTDIKCGSSDISSMYRLSMESIRLNRRCYTLPEGRVTGYTTGDSENTMNFWMRDMFYSMGGYAFFERDLKSGFEALWKRQHTDGYFPDWVDETGQSGRMTSESDVEYIAVLALERIWLITGDDDWMKKHLPVVERGLEYLTRDPMRWDMEHGMVKRGHTCDTWDFDIYTDDKYTTESPSVAAICDQTGLYAAWMALSRIYSHLDDYSRSEEYERKALLLKERCNNLLWDGTKYRHHLHLGELDHGDFDEGEQLAMGNAWAMTRGLADMDQCLNILDTYCKRWSDTGHRFPWWSLEPGYPSEMGDVLQKNSSYLCPGGYCNGGLMPWVGAALSLAAFRNGREELGARLLLDCARFLEENDGRIYTWYWPDMQPGFRTTTCNTTGHDGWGMGYWMDTLVEGLIGLNIKESGLKKVAISPRWASVGIKWADIVLCFPAKDGYIAYRYRENEKDMDLSITGTVMKVNLQIMLPQDKYIEKVSVNGKDVESCLERIMNTVYLVLSLKDGPLWDINVVFV